MLDAGCYVPERLWSRPTTEPPACLSFEIGQCLTQGKPTRLQLFSAAWGSGRNSSTPRTRRKDSPACASLTRVLLQCGQNLLMQIYFLGFMCFMLLSQN